jgi:hypothetical protein
MSADDGLFFFEPPRHIGGIFDQDSDSEDAGIPAFQYPRHIPCGWNGNDRSARQHLRHDYGYGYGIISRDRQQSSIQSGSATESGAPDIPGGSGGGEGSKRVYIAYNKSKSGNNNLAPSTNKQQPSLNVVGMSDGLDNGDVQIGGDTSPQVPSSPPTPLGVSRVAAANIVSADSSPVGKGVRERENSVTGTSPINIGDGRVVEYQSRSPVIADPNPKQGVEVLPSYGTNSGAMRTFHPDLESNPWT